VYQTLTFDSSDGPKRANSQKFYNSGSTEIEVVLSFRITIEFETEKGYAATKHKWAIFNKEFDQKDQQEATKNNSPE
jgi:hypothetical protein